MDSTFLLIIIGLGTILFSSIVHEITHAFVSDRLGDDTARHLGRLSFNPLVHIDPFGSILLPSFLLFINIIGGVPVPIFGAAKPVPFNPYRLKFGEYGPAIVAVAGPLSNLLMAFLVGFGISLAGVDASSMLFELSSLFILINLGFFVFNMIPFPPLDGSRLLYSFAPESVRRLMESIERQGLFAIALLLVFFQGPLSQFMSESIFFLYRLML
ncbi:TPA: site-2 protease family protein [Candidatus Saccharibacteria bacterium]|nr:site-2 protease family protein [Candidatus Saccharibacteria bacterium]HIO87689.1 site-2 protease family protein [Candidatus Saccharibacteria bacterium]